MGSSHAHLLVVDDDPAIRGLMEDALTALGHSVVTAADVEAAIDSFVDAREQSTPFDAVVTDLILGGSEDGLSLLRRLRTLEPGLRAMVFTGDPEAAAASEYEAYGFQARLDKPFRLEDLDAAVETVLNY